MPALSILAALFLWSSVGVIVRRTGVSEIPVIFYSSLVAVLFQGLVMTLAGWGNFIPREKRHFRSLVLLGCLGLMNTFAFYYAFRHTTIANTVLTHYIAPVIVAFLAALFLKEKVTFPVILAIALSSAGLLIMLGGLSFSSSQTHGIIAGLLSGLAYACIIILARSFTAEVHPLMMSFVPNAVILVILLPFVREFPAHAVWSFVLMGVVHSTAAPMMYYWGMKYVTANRTAVLGYLEPFSAILLSMLFLDEVPGLKSLLGGGLILFSGYLTLRARENSI